MKSGRIAPSECDVLRMCAEIFYQRVQNVLNEVQNPEVSITEVL